MAADDGPTTLTLEGSGFQSVAGGFGGIYILFGSVTGDAWAPSQGGGFGTTYFYQPDTQDANNAGMQGFVAFPGSSTEGDAGGVMTDDGSWSTELIVSGPVFTVTDADGAERELDCRVETCGVITLGAHGVVNASNETFTPVSFEAAGGTVEAQTEATEAGAEETEAAAPSSSDTGEEATDATTQPATEETSATEAASTEAEDAEESSGPNLAVLVGSGVVAIGGVTAAIVVTSQRRKKAQSGGNDSTDS